MSDAPGEYEKPEGVEKPGELGAWANYPIDSVLVRQEPRSVFEVVRRINQGAYIMNPEFQRAFLWPIDMQSRLIESVLMRIPLPVFYLAEDQAGKLIVVDGLQRLTTLQRYLNNEFALEQIDHADVAGLKFGDLPPKLQNRIEDTQLILYIIDAKVAERARLDIFERVNLGVPLTRQQMRNCLYTGPATAWLKEEAATALFQEVTGGKLDPYEMKDREAVNRFCSFYLLGTGAYSGDIDLFLANGLKRMNNLPQAELDELRKAFRRGLENNRIVFGERAFRKHDKPEGRRNPFNFALFDVFSAELAKFDTAVVEVKKDAIRQGFFQLMVDEEFMKAITQATTGVKHALLRFNKASAMLQEIISADPA